MERIHMRAHRALVLLATAGAAVVATAGTALVGPGAAIAAPAPAAPPATTTPQAYPPPAPSLTTNHGTIRAGGSVRLTGRHFGFRDRVRLTIRYPTGPIHGRTRSLVVRTDRQGNFRVTVRLTRPGRASITARGLRWHKHAAVTVRVLRRHRPHTAPAGPPAGSPLATGDPLAAGAGPYGILAAQDGVTTTAHLGAGAPAAGAGSLPRTMGAVAVAGVAVAVGAAVVALIRRWRYRRDG
jgi:hypothetical protein